MYNKLSALLLVFVLVGCGTQAAATSLPSTQVVQATATPVATAKPTVQPTTKPTVTSIPASKPTPLEEFKLEPTTELVPAEAFVPEAGIPLRLIVRQGDNVLIDTSPIAQMGAAHIDGKYLPLTDNELATWFKGYCGFNEACNQLIQAHAANKSKPFKSIGKVKAGDTAEVWTADAIYTFKVEESKLIKWSNTTYIKREKGTHVLTLMTCDGNFTKVDGVLVADSRWVVRATLVSVQPR